MMNIQLTPEQENLIQTQVQTGKYKSAQEIVAIALIKTQQKSN